MNEIDDTLEHPYVNEDPEIISMLEQAERESYGGFE